MGDHKGRNWWLDRRDRLQLEWVATNVGYLGVTAPQTRWVEIGSELGDFNRHLNMVEKFSGEKPLPKAENDRLYDALTSLMWSAEAVLLRCPGLENYEQCQRFLGHITSSEAIQDKLENPRARVYFLHTLVPSAQDFLSGVSRYLDSYNEVIEIPCLPHLVGLVDLQEHIYEARDILSIGYVKTALFVLTRCIESAFRAIADTHLNPPKKASKMSFDELTEFLAVAKLPHSNSPVLSSPMRSVASNLRSFRNVLAHADGLSDPFLLDSTDHLAHLAIALLRHLDDALGRFLVESRSTGASNETEAP